MGGSEDVAETDLQIAADHLAHLSVRAAGDPRPGSLPGPAAPEEPARPPHPLRSSGGSVTLVDLASYVAAAATAGVIGNVSYDAVTALYRRATRRPRRRRPDADDVLEQLVFVTIRDQCVRHELRVPERDDVRITGWRSGPGRATASVALFEGDVRATVTVPFASLRDHGVHVQLTGAAPAAVAASRATATWQQLSARSASTDTDSTRTPPPR